MYQMKSIYKDKKKFRESEDGYARPRLINIDIDYVIPDELHLLL